MSEQNKKASRAFWDSPAGQARREQLRERFRNQDREALARRARKRWKKMDPEKRKAQIAKMRGAIWNPEAQRKGALARWAKMTPQERAAHMRMMGKARYSKPPSEAALRALAAARARLTPEKLSEMGKKGSAAMNAKTTKEQKRANARFGVAMKHFKKRGYIVEVE